MTEHPVSNGAAMHLRGNIRRNGIKVTMMASVPAEAVAGSGQAGASASIPREPFWVGWNSGTITT